MAKKGRLDRWTELGMDDKLILVEMWARDGLTHEEIAHNLGISIALLYKWKKEKIEFLEVLKKGREVMDAILENAMFKSALGFHYKEQSVTNKGEIVTIEKYEKPNVTQQIFLAKNRMTNKYKDKHQHEHTGKDDGPIQFVAEWGDDGGGSKD